MVWCWKGDSKKGGNGLRKEVMPWDIFLIAITSWIFFWNDEFYDLIVLLFVWLTREISQGRCFFPFRCCHRQCLSCEVNITRGKDAVLYRSGGVQRRDEMKQKDGMTAPKNNSQSTVIDHLNNVFDHRKVFMNDHSWPRKPDATTTFNNNNNLWQVKQTKSIIGTLYKQLEIPSGQWQSNIAENCNLEIIGKGFTHHLIISKLLR